LKLLQEKERIKKQDSLLFQKWLVIEKETKKQENVGSWTEDEHACFLKGLALYGQEWSTLRNLMQIAALVSSRSVVQTRTHAQKYFQKLKEENIPSLPSGNDRAIIKYDKDRSTYLAAAISLHTETITVHQNSVGISIIAPLSSPTDDKQHCTISEHLETAPNRITRFPIGTSIIAVAKESTANMSCDDVKSLIKKANVPYGEHMNNMPFTITLRCPPYVWLNDMKTKITVQITTPKIGIAIEKMNQDQHVTVVDEYTAKTNIHIKQYVPLKARLISVNHISTKHKSSNQVREMIGIERPVVLTFDWSSSNDASSSSVAFAAPHVLQHR
jgi:SHAQKYF class myb-like DNA-binding protein